jgi:hypothetical protein
MARDTTEQFTIQVAKGWKDWLKETAKEQGYASRNNFVALILGAIKADMNNGNQLGLRNDKLVIENVAS